MRSHVNKQLCSKLFDPEHRVIVPVPPFRMDVLEVVHELRLEFIEMLVENGYGCTKFRPQAHVLATMNCSILSKSEFLNDPSSGEPMTISMSRRAKAASLTNSISITQTILPNSGHNVHPPTISYAD